MDQSGPPLDQSSATMEQPGASLDQPRAALDEPDAERSAIAVHKRSDTTIPARRHAAAGTNHSTGWNYAPAQYHSASGDYAPAKHFASPKHCSATEYSAAATDPTRATVRIGGALSGICWCN